MKTTGVSVKTAVLLRRRPVELDSMGAQLATWMPLTEFETTSGLLVSMERGTQQGDVTTQQANATDCQFKIDRISLNSERRPHHLDGRDQAHPLEFRNGQRLSESGSPVCGMDVWLYTSTLAVVAEFTSDGSAKRHSRHSAEMEVVKRT